MAFRLCAAACFVEAARLAGPRVLEPVMSLDVTVVESRVGDVMGDVQRRRGAVKAVDAVGADRVVHAEVPLAEMFGYASDLRSRTQGRGTFTMALLRHDFVPDAIIASIRV
jgi:elongation factor G